MDPDIRKKFFMMKVVKHWNRMSKEVVDTWKQGEIRWGFEQPDLLEGVRAHCRGVGLDEF